MANSPQFQHQRNLLVDKFKEFIEEYEEFTKEVSPRDWRSTGYHIYTMKGFVWKMENLEEISKEQLRNPKIQELLKD